MASKATTERSNFFHPQTPPTISTSDKVLASRISLPANSHVIYSVFKATGNTLPPHETIELARRQILTRNGSATLLDSLLTSVDIGKTSLLYVFVISSQENNSEAGQLLETLHFSELIATDSSSFCLQDFFTDLQHDQKQHRIHTSIPFSNEKLHSHFLDALRLRLIDDIVNTSLKSPQTESPRRQIKRFKEGILISSHFLGVNWESSWNYKSIIRPLIYTHIQVAIAPQQLENPSPQLIIHPIPTPTPFLELSTTLPLPTGSPIVLLPFGTPAYFLSVYTGPITILIKQFRESLHGLGVGNWENLDSPCGTTFTDQPATRDIPGGRTSFIIGWIKVENKQGEDKGMTIIYPARLCLAYCAMSPPRPLLDHIPELPVQLQPSPQVPPTVPLISSSIQSARISGKPISSHSFCLGPSELNSPTTESLQAFRMMTLSKSKDVRKVALEVGGYVEAVAREREKERERLKRERENTSASPKLARTTTTPGSAPTPISIGTPTPVQALAPPPTVQSANSIQPYPQIYGSTETFYPSPPQSNTNFIPTLDGKTSPAIEEPIAPSTNVPGSISHDVSSELTLDTLNSVPPSYDPLGNIDHSWSQPAQSYLDVDFSMNMSLGFDMGSMAGDSGSGGGGAFNGRRNEVDYEDAFTDDDFSFFDRPSRTTVETLPLFSSNIHNTQGLTGLGPYTHPMVPKFANESSSFNEMQPCPVPGSTISNSNAQNTAWTPAGLLDGFTPRSIDYHPTNLPDLMPSSPGPSPDSHSTPTTPNVYLDTISHSRASSISESKSYLFDPIPFASYHRTVDGKYLAGKFSLPSPPAVEDIKVSSGGWKCRYNAATDPRIGLVQKLIGVKRKMPFEQGGRESSHFPHWNDEQEGWQETESDKQDDDDANSELSEDEDVEVNESPPISRPNTPPPAYLPLGPTLLHSKFQHLQLLPLCTPLRPPGAAVAPTSLVNAAPLASVPTPVSPAATLGAASEQSKSLEAAALMIANEIVENCLWAKSWKSISSRPKYDSEVWLADIKTVADLLQSIPYLESSLDMRTLFDLDPKSKAMQTLDPPLLAVGKGDAVIQVLPPALRFWDKLGLGPKAGKKDVTAFVLFEDDGDQYQTSVENWISSLSTAYQTKHMGELKPGNSGFCAKSGLIPIRFDSSFRKSLTTFIGSLSEDGSNFVFFIICPITAMNLRSPILRQITSSIQKAQKNHPNGKVLFQFIPESYVLGPMEQTQTCDPHIENLCFSLYNRILIPVYRNVSQVFGSIRSHFQTPAFTLGRSLCSKLSFARTPNAPLDVVDRHTLLHVGYTLCSSGKWVVAVCVDQRGEAHDIGVWLHQPTSDDAEGEYDAELSIIKRVWNFAVNFAKKANVEWRLVISKLGAMNNREIQVWAEYLSNAIRNHEIVFGDVSLLCVEPNAPWSFVDSHPASTLNKLTSSTRSSSSSSKHHSPMVFTDVSSTTYALFPNVSLPISVPATPADLGLNLSFIPEGPPTSNHSASSPIVTNNSYLTSPYPPVAEVTPESITASSKPHLYSYIPRSMSTLIRIPYSPSSTSLSMLHTYFLYFQQSSHSNSPVPNEPNLCKTITQNFYELSVLAGGCRNMDANPILPFHLAAVEAIRLALDPDPDVKGYTMTE